MYTYNNVNCSQKMLENPLKIAIDAITCQKWGKIKAGLDNGCCTSYAILDIMSIYDKDDFQSKLLWNLIWQLTETNHWHNNYQNFDVSWSYKYLIDSQKT